MAAFRGLNVGLWSGILLLCTLSSMASGSGKVNTLRYFFKDVESNADLTNITWAHAVNSLADLQKYLADDTNMLEADISMGRVNGSGEIIPIMAHPPAAESDLSFQDFIDRVLEAVGSGGAKKGIKLDFKDINTVEPCLLVLRKIKKLDFPVWLNADILRGPVNSTGTPVNATQFLNLTQLYFPNAMLSLGWTTSYSCEKRGAYEEAQISEMKHFLDNFRDKDLQVTFPVRAGIAAESSDLLLRLVAEVAGSTLTLWSSVGDPVDIQKLNSLITLVGKTRVYVDVPFDLVDGPGDVCNGAAADDHNRPHPKVPEIVDHDEKPISFNDTNNSNNTIVPDGEPGSSARPVASLLFLGLAVFSFINLYG